MGSKNKIAEWVVANLPPKKHFYDLFAGGCAVTHRAMFRGGWGNYHANDINDTPKLFMDAVAGKYRDEKRWISREDFARLKDADPYVRLYWSFGNNGQGYLYSREIEPWKKALHYARVYKDTSLLEDMGIKSDGSRADIRKNEKKYKALYIEWYCRNSLQRLEVTRLSYDKVAIAPDSVIYCDIPYRGTEGYNGTGFNHEAFYAWAERQTQPCFVSEYDMPRDRFAVYAETSKAQLLSGQGSGKVVMEQLFVPLAQVKKGIVTLPAKWTQGELF